MAHIVLLIILLYVACEAPPLIVRLLSAVFHGYRYQVDKSTKICMKTYLLTLEGEPPQKMFAAKVRCHYNI